MARKSEEELICNKWSGAEHIYGPSSSLEISIFSIKYEIENAAIGKALAKLRKINFLNKRPHMTYWIDDLFQHQRESRQPAEIPIHDSHSSDVLFTYNFHFMIEFILKSNFINYK